MSKVNWHALKIEDVFKEVGGVKGGLANEEAQARLVKYGLNVLPEDKRPSVLAVFSRQLRSPLVYVLLIAALITAVLREFIDMGVILAAVVVNAVIGFWQEWKADEAFSALKAMVRHNARVRRGGAELVVDASEIVPGDIVLLQTGDRVPADARLTTVFDFEANESALTGESAPVKKHLKPLPAPTMLAERANLVFQGTTVARGKAEALVVATGKHTAFGEIAMLVHKVEDPKTPLQAQLGKLAAVLGALTVAVVAFIFLLGVVQGRSIVEMFLTAVAVAVAAIPEGLLISLTVILAIGMRNLARRNAIVKRLLAAETLGSVTVICCDKTGTLTTGEMEVTELVTFDGKKPISSVIPSHSEGSHTILRAGGEISRFARNDSALQAWEAAVIGNDDQDSTPAALVKGGARAGLDPIKLARSFPKLDEVPFENAARFSATLHSTREGHNMLYVRGAPEKLLSATKLTAPQKRALVKKIEEMANRGLRLVAAAYLEVPREVRTIKEIMRNHTLPNGLVLAGLFGIKDPLRPHIPETIAKTGAAGIRTVMITGDHAKTAAAIAQEAGVRGEVLTGAEIDALDDGALASALDRVSVFARVLPKHKVRIVEAFHARGESVAMTGDGVNDAPALKAADIGVAVGSGTDVAKETADVVLTDNDFRTIVNAVEGGRNIYENIKKVVAYLLSNSWTEMIVIGGSLLAGWPLPFLPAQILWVNLMEDSFPNMALAFDPGEPHVMKERPRERHTPLFDFELKMLTFGFGILRSLLLFGMYYYFLTQQYDPVYTRTMMFVGLGLNTLFYIYSIRNLHRYIWHTNPFQNKFLLGATTFSLILLIGAVYLPGLQQILRTVPLAAADWLPLIGLGLFNIALIELIKVFFIRRRVHAYVAKT